MNKSYTIDRFPVTSNASLKAWSSVDEYILKRWAENDNKEASICILNDRFGYLSAHLHHYKPNIICNYKSQEVAILKNLEKNKIDANRLKICSFLEADLTNIDYTLIKVPKSIDLYHFFLLKAHQHANATTEVICGFKTKHFTKQILTIASIYFEEVNQSLTWKKSRLLLLSKPKMRVPLTTPIHQIIYQDPAGNAHTFQQYFGVFSAKHIDYATQFLLKHLQISDDVRTVLDLACGNGVIAQQIKYNLPDAELHLLDDAHLAIESAKLNVRSSDSVFHYNYNLDHLENDYFDLVVSNPPFHFEYENTIDIALQLFEGVARIMAPNGRFILVANRHLNYSTHLIKFFHQVDRIQMNSKFELLSCQ